MTPTSQLPCRAGQHTLSRSLTFIGIGLHTGRHVALQLRPAPADSGIRFVRTDLAAGMRDIQACWRNVVDTTYCTVLGNRHGTTISTVEHLLAALRSMGVDNARIEVNGPEVPAMDGSALPFAQMIRSNGLIEQCAPRSRLVIQKSVLVCEDGRYARLSPSPDSNFSISVEFPHPQIGYQRLALALDPESFERQLAPARTFGFEHEISALQGRGLALGGSARNAIVLDDERIVNPEGLRFDDEFVRHKLLDCVGDLCLAPARIVGKFLAHKPGHRLNNALLTTLLRDPGAWRLERAGTRATSDNAGEVSSRRA